jgi:hypothetical protein
MAALARNTRVTVIPCLRYRDAPAAIEWLCRSFGFEKHLVVPNDDGTIAHAQLPSRMKNTEGAASAAATWRDASGISELTIRGNDEVGK